MKRYTFEFSIDLPETYGADDVDLLLYRQGLKHFPYDWGLGDLISVGDAEDE